MPQTIQALAVVVIALLPGALYVWAVERQVGRWGVGLSDRVLRFVGGSAIFHAVVAPMSYGLWHRYARVLSAGDDVSWWLWSVPLLYVGVPAAAGILVGRGQRLGQRWTRRVTGPNPAPRGWDHLVATEADGWVRLRTKSGSWLGGVFADARWAYRPPARQLAHTMG